MYNDDDDDDDDDGDDVDDDVDDDDNNNNNPISDFQTIKSTDTKTLANYMYPVNTRMRKE